MYDVVIVAITTFVTVCVSYLGIQTMRIVIHYSQIKDPPASLLVGLSVYILTFVMVIFTISVTPVFIIHEFWK
ncbi:MAG: hypothetical protein KGJ35_01865 [Patescibacteria group bacterium]|nr:hypothetical protein [Patescibacteria group bacterium]